MSPALEWHCSERMRIHFSVSSSCSSKRWPFLSIFKPSSFRNFNVKTCTFRRSWSPFVQILYRSYLKFQKLEPISLQLNFILFLRLLVKLFSSPFVVCVTLMTCNNGVWLYAEVGLEWFEIKFFWLIFLYFAGLLSDEETPEHNKDVVLLDARNLYETRVGKFQTPNVVTLDPEIRQYSDLPSWIDDNSEKLQGKQILMLVVSNYMLPKFGCLFLIVLDMAQK